MYQEKKIVKIHLINMGENVFLSQTDEEQLTICCPGITFEIIKRLNIKKGSYAEYGVGDGLENNTILLAALGWKGFWVGGEDLNFKYKPGSKFNYSKNWITLDNILEITKKNLKKMNIKNLDVISLDLDGNDFHFTKKLLENRINPKLFIVEYNPKFFPPIEFIMKYNQFHNWLLDDNYGASLESFNKLFKDHDYKLICCLILIPDQMLFLLKRSSKRILKKFQKI